MGEAWGSAGWCSLWALADSMGVRFGDGVLVVRVRQLALFLCRGYVGGMECFGVCDGEVLVEWRWTWSSKARELSLPAAPSFPSHMHADTGYKEETYARNRSRHNIQGSQHHNSW